MGRPPQGLPARRDPVHPALVPAPLDRRHRARVGREVAPGAEHGIALDDVLDGLGAARRGHQRARRQALVAVTDHADVAVAVGDELDQLVLGLVGVLVLVDEDVLEPLLVLLQHVGGLAQQLDGLGEQVVEVHGVGVAQAPLVLAVDLGDAALVDAPGPVGVGVDPDELVLGRADHGVDGAGRELLGVDVEVAQHVGGEALGVGLVVDGERRRVAQPGGVAPQDAHAGGVERGHPHLLGDGPDQRPHPVLHLVGGLVGEGDGQDLEGRDALLLDEPADPRREHPGLARAGPGDDQQGPAGVGDGLPLDGIQVVEEGGTLRHGPIQGTGRVRHPRVPRPLGNRVRGPARPG